MRERLTARILLIGPSGRLLLIRFEDPRPSGPHVFWATAGGGLEDGESVPEAAAREILEETGLAEVEIGPVVWTHKHILHLSGEPVLFRESYVAARSPQEAVSGANMTELERSVIREMRWWTLGEIASSDEVIYPVGLERLLPPVLAGDYPTSPIALGGA